MKGSSAVLGAALLVLAGCELREITLAAPADVVIAEVILHAGAELQTAYLHRTSTGEGDARVYGAHVVVTDAASGESFAMEVAGDEVCLDAAPDPGAPSVGTCYAAAVAVDRVRPGRRYTLRIELPGGDVLEGSTTVPAQFSIVVPDAYTCQLAADTTLELVWTRAEGTAVYLVEAYMSNLRGALRQRGTDVDGTGAVELLGLSVTAADTTLTFPSELGLFDRFDEDIHPILLAIRDGLPPGVTTDLTVAAADRNYVNWVRGGNFNPSGRVRVSSLRGDGAGVFGSLTVQQLRMFTRLEEAPPGVPVCR